MSSPSLEERDAEWKFAHAMREYAAANGGELRICWYAALDAARNLIAMRDAAASQPRDAQPEPHP